MKAVMSLSFLSSLSMTRNCGNTLHQIPGSVVDVMSDCRTPFQPIKSILKDSFTHMNGKSRRDVLRSHPIHFMALVLRSGLILPSTRVGRTCAKDKAL